MHWANGSIMEIFICYLKNETKPDMSIKNLPLNLWRSNIFEVIGAYFGGLESIALETLNLIKCSEAIIKVKIFLCGFLTATIELKSETDETQNFQHKIIETEILLYW